MSDVSLHLNGEKITFCIIKDEFKGPKREDEGDPLREAIIQYLTLWRENQTKGKETTVDQLF